MEESPPSLPERLIAHLDMDAFYASVELLRYPELKGLPVVVGGRREHAPRLREDGTREYSRLRDYTGRGVITTATYAARDLGVNSGMGLMKAALRAPDAILLPTDFDSYRHYSRLFKAAVAEVAPVIEDRGIDEIYIDLSEVPGVREPVGHDPLGGVKAIAREIKNSVRNATGLTCSIGITPNKLLSKIASELDKPDGLTVLTLADLETRIWPLAARKINGIGPKAAAKLSSLGVETVGDIAEKPLPWLVEQFGKTYGAWLHEASHGRDKRPVVTFSEPVSISRETTFERDLHAVHDRALLGRIFTELCEQLARDLGRKGYQGRTIGIKLRFEGFVTVTRDLTLDVPVADAASIRRAAGLCLKRVDLGRRLRLLGVRVGSLSHPGDPVPAPKKRPSLGTANADEAQAGVEQASLALFDPDQA
ncbi:DNA polymerase IV [Pelomonas sp. SE-A7]|uniref:DNA polymerase IV n=1 Tax=Pelomonas sp. SE-A7 TaxID=3054953 RepID=UPI00259CFA44|nr:DNA polymerase IV [Pelomonas sp. SE-A7]MDM4764569.1 DNA polymerase IV [Pelomonas sp. SE-A7]